MNYLKKYRLFGFKTFLLSDNGIKRIERFLKNINNTNYIDNAGKPKPKNYFKAITKGKYNLKRTIDLIINIGLLISLFITIVSGIITSQKSLKSLKIGKYKISHIHKYSSIVSLVFLGLHLLTTRKKLLREMKK